MDRDANLHVKKDNENEIEIDLVVLAKRLLKYWKMIVIATLVMGVLSLTVSAFFITEMYKSTARVYIKPENAATGMVDSSAIDATNKMVNNYIYMIKGDAVIDKVAGQMEAEIDAATIKKVIEVTSEPDSAIIKISATTPDPAMSKEIVERLIAEFFAKIDAELDIKSTMVIDQPRLPKNPDSPNVAKNTVLGMMLGFVFSVAFAALKIILDKKLKSKKEAEEYLGIPVLAEICDWEDK